MSKTAVVNSYQFKRVPKPVGMIQVLNEGSYIMAEYSELTGETKWQRLVLATQREHIESWLREKFPKKPAAAKKHAASQ